MRWTIYFLLILNAVIFSWFQFHNYYSDKNVSESSSAKKFNFSAVPTIDLIVAKEVVDAEFEEENKITSEDVLPNLVDNCWLVGTFPEIISARDMRIELEGRGVYSHIIEKEVELPAISWVYIPPFANREEAMPVLRSLQIKGIDSFLVVDEGEYQFSISLGFFGNKESAEKIKRERIAQGYDARVTDRVRKRAAYWLSIYEIQHSDSAAMHKNLANVLKQKKSLKKSEISCKELALFETKH